MSSSLGTLINKKGNKKMYLYLRLTGCVVWTAAIILTCVFVFRTIRAFREDETTGMKIGAIFSIIGTAVIGTGLGILFYQVANLIK